MRYLGVLFDVRKKYADDIERGCEEGMRVFEKLHRLLLNAGDLATYVSRLYYSIWQSIVHYGAWLPMADGCGPKALF